MIDGSKTNRLLRRLISAFPVPKIMSMPAAAIDISDTSIKYLDADFSYAGFIPKNFESTPLEEGAVAGGVVRNLSLLVDSLKKLRKKHKRKFAFISLPEELAYLFTVQVQDKDIKNLKEIVEFSIGENVPISAKDSIFDYELIEDSLTGGGVHQVSVSVYERGIVEGYLSALSLAGFIVKGCELEAYSIARSAIPRGESGTAMVIDFGRERTCIIITSGRTPIFTTTVHVGGESITKSIMEYKKVDEKEADRIKREIGLLQKEDTKLESMLINNVRDLVGEIKRHYQFWDTRRDKYGRRIKKIENIYLCGGASGLLGLPEYVMKELNVQVETANVWQNMFDMDEYVPPISKSISAQYATTAGLILKDIE